MELSTFAWCFVVSTFLHFWAAIAVAYYAIRVMQKKGFTWGVVLGMVFALVLVVLGFATGTMAKNIFSILSTGAFQ